MSAFGLKKRQPLSGVGISQTDAVPYREQSTSRGLTEPSVELSSRQGNLPARAYTSSEGTDRTLYIQDVGTAERCIGRATITR